MQQNGFDFKRQSNQAKRNGDMAIWLWFGPESSTKANAKSLAEHTATAIAIQLTI